MSSFKTFSFRDCDVIFGIIEFQEFDEGSDSVSMSMAKEQWKKKVGAKGDVVRIQTNDNSAELRVNLLQTSRTNKDLFIQYNLDKETGGGVAPFVIRNRETGETYIANNAWIKQAPDVNRGNDDSTMAWVFDADSVTHLIV